MTEPEYLSIDCAFPIQVSSCPLKVNGKCGHLCVPKLVVENESLRKRVKALEQKYLPDTGDFIDYNFPIDRST